MYISIRAACFVTGAFWHKNFCGDKENLMSTSKASRDAGVPICVGYVVCMWLHHNVSSVVRDIRNLRMMATICQHIQYCTVDEMVTFTLLLYTPLEISSM